MRTDLEIVRIMTFRLLVLLFLSSVTAACGGPNFMDKTKIDGSVLRGTAVMPGDEIHGRTVYIAKNFSLDITDMRKFNKFGLCSGVLLSEQYVATAAHCTTNLDQSRIIFSEDVNQPLMMDQVYTIIDHRIPDAYKTSLMDEKLRDVNPGPNNRSHRYDIAILKLDRPIKGAKFSSTYFKEISAVKYITSIETTRFDSDAIVAGYGRISEYSRLQDDPRFKNEIQNGNAPALNGTLMKANMTLSLAELSDRTINRSQRFSSGVCAGDSGGPLFTIRNGELYLQALAIATYKVKMEDPANVYNACYGESIYLNLDYLKTWMQEAIRMMEKTFPEAKLI